jgi:hypothetical protein
MNLTECEIRSVLFMGLVVEWKSGTLHIRTIKPSDKLNYRKFKLFKIIRYIKGTNFEL